MINDIYQNSNRYVKIKLTENSGKVLLNVNTQNDTKGAFKKFISEKKISKHKIENNIFQTNDPKEISKIFDWAIKKRYISSHDSKKVKKLIHVQEKDRRKPVDKKEAEKPKPLQPLPGVEKQKGKEIVRPQKVLVDGDVPPKVAAAVPPKVALDPLDKHVAFPKTHELVGKNEKFLDPNHLLKGKKDQELEPEHTAWAMAYAMLNLNRKGLSPDVQKQLDFLIFQAYSKAAYSPKGAKLGMQENPQYRPGEEYHRLGTQFLRDLDDAYEEELKLTGKAAVHLIDSPLFKEVLERRYDCKVIGNKKSLEEFIDKALSSHARDPAPMIVDLSKFATAKDAELFDHVLKQRVSLYNSNHKNKVSADKLDYINPVIFTEHKGEKLLVIPERGGGGAIPIDFHTLIGEAGFRLSPDRAKKAYLKVKSLDEQIFVSAKLGTAGETIPTVFENIKAFAAAPIFRQLEELSSQKGSLTVQRQAKATANLLTGLAKFDIDASFAKKNLTPFLQMAYFALGNSAHMAIQNKDNPIEFNNQIELIHQVLQSILEIAQPYGPGTFEASTIAGLKDSRIIPPTINDPRVHLKSSAMHSLNSVLSAVEKQKGQTKLNVAVIKDSYYETKDAVKGASKHATSVLDIDAFNKAPGEAVRKLNNMPLDVFICEFHHNTQEDKHEYSPIKAKEQIKEILTQNKGHPVTVVIDNTIGLEHSEELRALLADVDIQKGIQGGKLNLVLLRSAQKYDMLGQDNYYGGITTTFNAPQAFSAFNTRMDDPADQMVGFNYQGLTHIHQHAQAEVEAYRKALASNTEKLYQKLLEKGVEMGESDKYYLQVAKKSDQNIPFLHIRGISMNSNTTVDDLFEFAAKHNLPLTDRASFGFSNANITEFDDGLRLNLGLEDEAAIEKYAQFIADAQKASLKED